MDMTHKDNFKNLDIAVLLPCYNEGAAIASVIMDFRRALPGKRIFVYDNNSSDDTSEQAARAGATVIPCRRQGKGDVAFIIFCHHVVCHNIGRRDIGAHLRDRFMRY